MHYENLRKELKEYYIGKSYENAAEFLKKATEKLDSLRRENMSSYEMKTLQYDVITDLFEPILFENCPFYYETGTIPGKSDGARNYHSYRHAGGWTYERNFYRFEAYDRELWALSGRQRSEIFYLICGAYNDDAQHFLVNHRPIFAHGLHGVYREAENALHSAETPKEREFLSAVLKGLLCVKKAAEKFAEKASMLSERYPQNENYRRIAESAARCPWERPQSFYEALNTYAFMRKIIGTLEGVGPNSFGRIDMDLLPFYEGDIQDGRLTKDEAFRLISQFLIVFDCHYDHDMKMVGYGDHELENTYVLGGCDADGKPVFNELTEMFLKATTEEKIIFPKIKCRYSASSPKAYLDLVNEPIIRGTSTVLYQNDDASIPALIRSGIPEKDARDYVVSGCWGMNENSCGGKDGGNYVNLLKAFECEIHNRTDLMEKVGMHFDTADNAESFEEVYHITCQNIGTLFKERNRITELGGHIWEQVDPLPIFSSLYGDCIQNRRDFTDYGARYTDECYMCVGFPNIVDSLFAIKTLCFDRKKYTLCEMLSAVRNNWQGREDMRREAMLCPGWGDGSEESCTLAARFNSDLYRMLSELHSPGGGKIILGHLTYTEIRFWGERTLATPDGRHDGDYIAQGLTPSRLKKNTVVTNVINSMAAIDRTELAGNCVLNVILPGTTSLAVCEAFLRTAAMTALESLQLNCVSRDTLLDAQKHPEKYPDLIVRVCGFSAKFTALSPEWQKEVLTRNFYE